MCLLAFWALPCAAQVRQGPPSLDRVLPQIRRSTPGTFYDAQGPFIGPNGQPSYRIKWMTPDGRIIWFSADARTGQIVGMGPPGPMPPANRYGEPYRFRDDGWPPGGNHFGPDRGWNGGNWGGHGGGDWNGRGGNWNGHGGNWNGHGGGDHGRGRHGG